MRKAPALSLAAALLMHRVKKQANPLNTQGRNGMIEWGYSVLNTKGTIMKIVCISFGENCVTDDILRRSNLRSFTTPYSWARSNIEYILQIEKDNFADFLNRDYLKHELLIDRKKARLKQYCTIENTYNPLHMNGFEFSHHDIIENEEAAQTIRRRCQRLQDLKGKTVYAFYHHRYCEKTDRAMLIRHLLQLKEFYLENRCSDMEVVMFTQVIVNDPAKRKVTHRRIDGIHVYEFYTTDVWGGGDLNIQPGECDKDLLKIMIRSVKISIFWKRVQGMLYPVSRILTDKPEKRNT